MKQSVLQRFAVAACCVMAGTLAAADMATGVVYHDANANGVRDTHEKGLAQVRVSNGREIVRTDARGQYRVELNDGDTLFVIKPRGWQFPLNENRSPQFWYNHRPNGSPQLKYAGIAPTGPLPRSLDFGLRPSTEPNRFEAIILGDTQVYDHQQIRYLERDIVAELAGSSAAFVATLGDNVGDHLDLMEPMAQALAQIGRPVHYVKGNHDSNYDGAPDWKLTSETFTRVLGPPCYAFDYGPVHFIIINNPWFEQSNRYIAKLDPDQMAFLKNDLALLPRNQLVVLMMHIPIMEMEDRAQIYALLAKHPHAVSLSAHWHTQEHFFLGSRDGWPGAAPHHHLVAVTACGSWWNGMADEVGVPHTTMRDGAPNGWLTMRFDGNRYSMRYRAARRPADYQMEIDMPAVVKRSETRRIPVTANVFFGSAKSEVSMRLDPQGDWIPLTQSTDLDPVYARTIERERALPKEALNQLPGPQQTPHVWKGSLPTPAAGAYRLEVRSRDMFGQIDTAYRVFRVQ